MIETLKEKLSEKSILILGFGKEGRSTYNLFRKIFPKKEIAIADQNIDSLNIIDNHVIKYGGNTYMDTVNDYDIIIKSPGISLKDKQFIDKSKITSQTDLFLALYKNQTIGITGTKGKSTTTSLIYHTLKKSLDNVVLVGNIGVPPFDVVDRIDDKTWIVFEMSSHQLEFVTASPHISILLNIYEEHLDHYTSYRDYQLAKFNIARYQSENDFFIYNVDNDLLKNLVNNSLMPQICYEFSAYYRPKNGSYVNDYRIMFVDKHLEKEVFSLKDKITLKGLHNVKNMMAAICVFEIIGVEYPVIKESFATFKGLPHRLEYVGEYNGITFFNDSIATIPEATIAALKALHNVRTLILGGFDRGIDYSVLVSFLVDNAPECLIFMGDAGKRMLLMLNEAKYNKGELIFVEDLKQAVEVAMQKTEKGGTCLLSPAAASYDRFKNFEERGNLFKSLISEA